MANFLKQIFCNHIWKDVKKEFLNKRLEHIYELQKTCEVHNYAVTQECVICKEQKIIKVSQVPYG